MHAADQSVRLENDRVSVEIDPRRGALTRLALKRSAGPQPGDVGVHPQRLLMGSWRLWCAIDGQRHRVQETFNPHGGDGVRVEGARVTIPTRFGRSADQCIPVAMEITYVLDTRGVWMYGLLSTEVPVQIEQLEYITFFQFHGDAHRDQGRAFIAPGWSDRFEDLGALTKKCDRNSSAKYFYSAPWLDRRAMGWSWRGKGIWFVFPNACATRGRFQKDIGVFYHLDDRGPEHRAHYITLQAEAQHHYKDCEWYTLPRNPFAEQEDADITCRPDMWTVAPGVRKYYGPYLIALTDASGEVGDADEAGYRQACAWGEALRRQWPPSWFPVRSRPVRFRIDAPTLTDGQHYCLVLYNSRYWFSGQTTESGELAIDVLTNEPFRGAVIRTDDKLSRFAVLRRLFGGRAAALDATQVYPVDLRRAD